MQIQKGRFAVQDTCQTFKRGADSCYFTFYNDTLHLMPEGTPTNFSSSGSSQWTDIGRNIYFDYKVGVGTSDTTYKFRVYDEFDPVTYTDFYTDYNGLSTSVNAAGFSTALQVNSAFLTIGITEGDTISTLSLTPTRNYMNVEYEDGGMEYRSEVFVYDEGVKIFAEDEDTLSRIELDFPSKTVYFNDGILHIKSEYDATEPDDLVRLGQLTTGGLVVNSVTTTHPVYNTGDATDVVLEVLGLDSNSTSTDAAGLISSLAMNATNDSLIIYKSGHRSAIKLSPGLQWSDTLPAASNLATQDDVRNTDSVGTVVRGTWNATPIDTAKTDAVSNVTTDGTITIVTEGKTKKLIIDPTSWQPRIIYTLYLNMTQSGSNDPSVFSSYDDCGCGSLTVTRLNPGEYNVNCSNAAFASGKTTLSPPAISVGVPAFYSGDPVDDNNYIIRTYDSSGSLADDLMFLGQLFQIQISIF